MTQQNGPMDITQSTLPILTEAAKTARDVTATPNADNDFEMFLGYIERFTGHLERIRGVVSGMKEQQNGKATPAQDSPAPEVKEVVKTVEVGKIEAIEIYQIALGYLAKCPEDMPAGELLRLARTMKGQVISQIQAELDAIYAERGNDKS